MTLTDRDEEFLDWMSEVMDSGVQDEFPAELEDEIIEAARRLEAPERPTAWGPSLALASILAIVGAMAAPGATSGLPFAALLLIAGLYATGTNRILKELPTTG